MRRLILGVGITLLGFASPSAAQNTAIPQLERFIDVSYRIQLPAHECTIPSAVIGLARRYHLIAGVEYLLVDCQRLFTAPRRDGEVVNLQGLSIGEGLKKLAEIDPRYRWMEVDGVVVVRPLVSWTDPKNMLNFTTQSFVLEDVNVGSALAAVVSALQGYEGPSQHLHTSAQGTEQGARQFKVKTGTTSVGEALNAIVRAHGAAWWEIQLASMQENAPPVIRIHTFDGTGLGLTVMDRRQR